MCGINAPNWDLSILYQRDGVCKTIQRIFETQTSVIVYIFHPSEFEYMLEVSVSSNDLF